MTGKKGKKNKGVSLSLGEFLGTSNAGGNASVIVKPASSWADETAEFEEDRPTERISLPTAPRTARGPDVDPSTIPNKPPFTAYIANLPFEVDDEDIERFFEGMTVKSIRLPKEGGENGRFKGFGYVEFETRNELIEALNKNEDAMGNRKIRVDIAEGESGNRRGGFSDRGPREEFEDRSGGVSDWRRAPPPERSERSPPRRGGFEDRDRGGGGFGDRDRDRGGFGDRDRGGFGDRDRDRGGFGDRDRDRGGFGDRDRDRGGFGDRDRDRGGFGDRDRGGGRYGDRDRDRDGGGSRGDGEWRPRGGGDRDGGGDKDGPPKERPRLNLKPRTAPAGEEKKAAPAPSGGGGGGGGGGGIFGNAKPVDTMKKELEIESKMEAKPTPPKSFRSTGGGGGGSIFGDAKPVDTASRERKIEEKIIKIEPREGLGGRRDDRRDDRGRDNDSRRDDRRDDRGRDNDSRRDDRRDDRGRDNDSRRDDRRDDRGRDNDSRRDDRRDDRGRDSDPRGDDRRDDRGDGPRHDDRRDDRGRDIRGGSRDIRLDPDEREAPSPRNNSNHEDDKEPPAPRMKTLKDESPVLDTTNKFAGLDLEEEET